MYLAMIVNIALTEVFCHLNIENYSLYSYILNLGVSICIYVGNGIKYITLHVSQNCIEKYVELCAVQIDTKSHIVIICIYKSTQGNIANFLICGNVYKLLVGQLSKDSIDCIVGYIQFVSSYISFPTKVFKCEVELIDIVFIYITRFHSYTVSQLVNRLCDHSAQYLILKDVFNLDEIKGFPCTTRLICRDSISYF